MNQLAGDILKQEFCPVAFSMVVMTADHEQVILALFKFCQHLIHNQSVPETGGNRAGHANLAHQLDRLL